MQSSNRMSVVVLAGLVSPLLAALPASAEELPAIKASAVNVVPACATPGRLQAYLATRNPALEPRFKTIAVDYMREGEALGVRWDFAFFQMILETGQLTFRDGSRAGDVKPSQNNFAGLGATGGVPGESFPDVATGVRAHLQHVMIYAGEKPDNLVAERTRKVLEWGVLTDWQKGLKRPITYTDLAAKWSPKSTTYAASLVQLADQFAADHCKTADPHPEYLAAALSRTAPQKLAAAAPEKQAERPAERPTEKPVETAADPTPGVQLARQAPVRGDGAKSALGATNGVKVINAPAFDEPPAVVEPPAAKPLMAATLPSTKPATSRIAAMAALPKATAQQPEPPAAQPPVLPQASRPSPAPTAASGKCHVWTASYGGQRAVIIKSVIDSVANFTVLDVNEGQEAREADAFIAAYARGGTLAGAFPDQTKALEKAFELCPDG
jgi:Mannosyl-glycoprotein endo-beta-N-acetylglucosaminidase